MQVRTPAVAGMFYPKSKQELQKKIKDCFLDRFGPRKLPPIEDSEQIIGVICPHAGYEYSGPIAANSFYAISGKKPNLVIMVGPNHWGIGKDIASMSEGVWTTPIGGLEVDTESAKELSNITNVVEPDYFSHTRDHCLEVQLPMLQETYKEFKILPIILNDQRYHTAIEVGKAIAKIVVGKSAIIIASSDFTHYEPNEIAHKKDKLLIEHILTMDVEKFYSTLEDNQISACGYGAIAIVMIACKELGATKGTLLRYATSGDIKGDKTSVVGYASIIFT